MSDFKNTVAYSESLAKMLTQCPRRYYYRKFRAWNGWWHKGVAPPERAEVAYVAKFSETTYTWIGKLVHSEAAWALRNAKWTKDLSTEHLLLRMTDHVSEEISIGLRQARSQSAGNPKRRLQLVECSNGIVLDEEYVRESTEQLIGALCSDRWTGAVTSNAFLRAVKIPERIVSVDELMSFEVDGTTVYFAVDLMMRARIDGDRNAIIIDWKTGQERRSDANQVKTYGSWAVSVGWHDVRLLLVYLSRDGTARVVEHRSSPEEAVEHVRSRVASFLDELRPRLVDGDTDRNEPIEEAFEPTENYRLCKLCEFQGVCARDGTKPVIDEALD